MSAGGTCRQPLQPTTATQTTPYLTFKFSSPLLQVTMGRIEAKEKPSFKLRVFTLWGGDILFGRLQHINP